MLLFLLVALAVGAGVDLYKRQHGERWDASEALAYKDSLRREFVARASELHDYGVQAPFHPDTHRAPTDVITRPRPGRVNINLATATELQRLPHVGPVLAGRIVAYREQHGPFKRVEDLRKVKGIGEKTLARIRPYLTID